MDTVSMVLQNVIVLDVLYRSLIYRCNRNVEHFHREGPHDGDTAVYRFRIISKMRRCIVSTALAAFRVCVK